MNWGGPEQLGVGGIGPQTVEERACLHLPAAQVGPRDLELIAVGELLGEEPPAAAPEGQGDPAAALAQIEHPLRVAAG